MATYQYEALNAQGQPQKGTIEAGTGEEAIQRIKLQGLFPTSVREQKVKRTAGAPGAGGDEKGKKKPAKKKKSGGGISIGKVKGKQLTTFTRQLSTLQDAGLPLLRSLQKQAVVAGGGGNHRMGLFDQVLIKDNHVEAVGSAAEAVRRARAHVGDDFTVEVELDDLSELEAVIEAGADVVMLDNMPPDAMREAVARTAGRVLLEASGGITLDSVRAVAESGVDLISVGWLTHSAPALDVALDFE